MNYEDKNFNEVLISGNINVITDTNDKYIKFSIKGYLNSYISKDNKIQSFITVTEISDNPDDILKGRKEPHIRYDPDGVEVWNGTRCESTPPSEEELKEMNDILSKFK